MAVAVFDLHGKVTASIHVVTPSIRFSTMKENLIADALRRAAAALSYRLGFSNRRMPPYLLTPYRLKGVM
jgi:DNA-binding IclR family transcriptional regulator